MAKKASKSKKKAGKSKKALKKIKRPVKGWNLAKHRVNARRSTMEHSFADPMAGVSRGLS